MQFHVIENYTAVTAGEDHLRTFNTSIPYSVLPMVVSRWVYVVHRRARSRSIYYQKRVHVTFTRPIVQYQEYSALYQKSTKTVPKQY